MDYAQEMVGKAQKRGVRLLLPVDTVCGDAFSPDAQRQVVPAGQIPRRLAGYGHRSRDRKALLLCRG